jgi:hypothetical protein
MEIVNDFVVNSPIDEAWATLTDVEKIAPCLPGAHLEGIDGDVFKGVVKVKVGPIQANFKGQAEFAEKDPVNHRAVLNAAGRDTGNKGNASAVITAQLEPIGAGSTKVTVATDLKITGKFAQFGRGAMQDISTKLLEEFVQNLETLSAAPAPAAGADNGAAPTDAAAGNGQVAPAPAPPPRDNVLDLGQVAGPVLLKRLLPVVGVALLLVVLLGWRRRRRA